MGAQVAGRGRELKVRVEGQLVFDDSAMRLSATLAGLGLAYLPEDQVQTHPADGRLIRVFDDLVPALFRLSPLLPEPCWSMRCVTGAETEASIGH